MDLARLGFEVDTGGLRRGQAELKGLAGQSDRTSQRVSNLGRTIRQLAGALAVGAAFRTIIRNTIEQERVTAQLNQTLRSTGRFTEELSRGLQDYASELQNVTTFGDEAIISSQALLLTFTQIGEEAFPRAQEAILDVATAMGMDLKSASLQVGKALNDPILGLTALQRTGIQFSDTQKEMIKDMVAVGDAAGAQAMILDELEKQFGGSARAARNTLGGALQSLSNAFGDLLEGDASGGGVTGTTEAINDLTDLLSSSEVKQAFGTLTEGIITVTGVVTESIVAFVEFGKAIGTTFAQIVHGTNDVGLQLAELWNEEYQLIARNNELKENGFKKYSRAATEYRKNQERILEIERERAQLESLRDLMSVGGSSGDGDGGVNIGIPMPNVPRLEGGDDGPAGVGDAEDIREQMERRRSALLQSLETEKQEVLRVFGERDAEISALEDERFLTEMQANQLRIDNERWMYDELDAMRQENIDKENDAIRERQEQALSMANSIVSITSTQVNQMANLFEEAGGIGKAFFFLSQGLAAANAVIQGFQSAMAIRVAYAQLAAMTANPGLLAAGEVHANVAQTMGFVTAGAIAAQTVASFDGGGYTGNGSRTGGMDGKGGFMAMLHPNETVIDHTKGQGQGVIININNAPQGTRTESRQGPDGQQIIDVFISDMSNGGPMSRSMQNTFGMRRQGR